MNEKKLVAVVVTIAVLLCATLCLGMVCTSKIKAYERAKDVAALKDTLSTTIARCNTLVAKREFEPASAALRELEPKITAMGDASIEKKFQQAWWDVDDAARHHKAKLDQGYSVFEGQFISKGEKHRILIERRKATERERLATEARARAEREAASERAAKERAAAEAEERKRQQEKYPFDPNDIAWVSATAILDHYKANEIAGDIDLKDKWFGVEGDIDTIGKDILGTPFVAFKTDAAIAVVQCMFERDSDQLALLAELRPGDHVGVMARCSGKMINVVLRKSVLIDLTDPNNKVVAK